MFTRFSRHVRTWWSLFADRRTPAMSKLLPLAGVLYLLSPLDLIPDLLPLLGQLDDVGILLLFISLALKWIPKDLWQEHEKKIHTANFIDL